MICSFVLALTPSCFGTSASATPPPSGSLTSETAKHRNRKHSHNPRARRMVRHRNRQPEIHQHHEPVRYGAGCGEHEAPFRRHRFPWNTNMTTNANPANIHSDHEEAKVDEQNKQQATRGVSPKPTTEKKKHGAKKMAQSTFTTPGKENNSTRFA